MEHLTFTLDTQSTNYHQQQMICGVVGSGNLEVLVSQQSHAPTQCIFEINTSAVGFKDVWQAVLTHFAQRHAVAGLTFQINDMGATPAVVSLRLAQAVALLKGELS